MMDGVPLRHEQRHESEVEGKLAPRSGPASQQLDGVEGREGPPREVILFVDASFPAYSEISSECQIQSGQVGGKSL